MKSKNTKLTLSKLRYPKRESERERGERETEREAGERGERESWGRFWRLSHCGFQQTSQVLAR